MADKIPDNYNTQPAGNGQNGVAPTAPPSPGNGLPKGQLNGQLKLGPGLSVHGSIGSAKPGDLPKELKDSQFRKELEGLKGAFWLEWKW